MTRMRVTDASDDLVNHWAAQVGDVFDRLKVDDIDPYMPDKILRGVWWRHTRRGRPRHCFPDYGPVYPDQRSYCGRASLSSTQDRRQHPGDRCLKCACAAGVDPYNPKETT